MPVVQLDKVPRQDPSVQLVPINAVSWLACPGCALGARSPEGALLG